MLCRANMLLHIFIAFHVRSVMSNQTLESLEYMESKKHENALKFYDWTVWCKLQPNSNDCALTQRQSSKYYYDIKMQDCMTFTYGTCDIAYNKFDTLSECHESCREPGKKPIPRKISNFTETIGCRLQPDFGDCQEYNPMFYYDINLRRCRGFSYSGCGGNINKFYTEQICSTTCAVLMDYELGSNHDD